MIDVEVEKFTATGAIEAGLVEAINRKDCVVSGSYRLSSDGYLELKQNNFVFNDKSGVLRVGKFADNYQLMGFCEEFSRLHGIKDEEFPIGIDYIADEFDEDK